MSPVEIASYLLTVVYVASFLMLTAAAARRTGRQIWLFGQGREPQALPALLFRLAFAGAIVWPLLRLAFDVGRHDPIAGYVDGALADVAGHVLIAVGACAAILSQLHMGASWRIGAAENEVGAIVDTGPFAFSRNPVFVGQAILFTGLFLAFPDIVQAALTLALIGAIILQARIEERVLAATLGEPYLRYQRRVRRWF
jgi:protein-S-isoprenylcysteine O-methyltransferase Ste14